MPREIIDSQALSSKVRRAASYKPTREVVDSRILSTGILLIDTCYSTAALHLQSTALSRLLAAHLNPLGWLHGLCTHLMSAPVAQSHYLVASKSQYVVCYVEKRRAQLGDFQRGSWQSARRLIISPIAWGNGWASTWSCLRPARHQSILLLLQILLSPTPPSCCRSYADNSTHFDYSITSRIIESS